MKRNTIYYVTFALTTLLLVTGCNSRSSHPWTGKTYEDIGAESGYRIRGGDPRTDGMEYVVFILKQDTAQLPDKAAFLTKDNHVILDALDVTFTTSEFYQVENITDSTTGAKEQYLVRKRYYPETDTAEPLELWRYNIKQSKIEHFDVSKEGERFVFGA
jgi:hypothetical protein